ncbi:hypothetical protein [Paenibacillus pinistramenti]|uniref:hypothetical protein n=1 Tax=Paenibacillus pinistramenti TaxID=1768003 RepID=UPI00110943D0|nr:hypothetical protein [Paenibacillus pinistramenti]
MSKKWIGVFTSPEDAIASVGELRKLGFAEDQLSLLRNYRTELLTEQDISGVRSFEIGGTDSVLTIVEIIGTELPDKESAIFDQHMNEGRYLLVADEGSRESGEVYQIFQRHNAVYSNYFEDGETAGEEHFYGIQSSADTYYGDQKANFSHGHGGAE